MRLIEKVTRKSGRAVYKFNFLSERRSGKWKINFCPVNIICNFKSPPRDARPCRQRTELCDLFGGYCACRLPLPSCGNYRFVTRHCLRPFSLNRMRKNLVKKFPFVWLNRATSVSRVNDASDVSRKADLWCNLETHHLAERHNAIWM